MDSHTGYQTNGSSALNPQNHTSQTPIIDFYRYANMHSASNNDFLQTNISFKNKLFSRLKNDELFQDFWLPERPKTKLANDNAMVLVTSAILFVPMAIGVMTFF